MSSHISKDKASPPQPKSKQERIRDNQRRSRARRQEYLADLERRLSECQTTCREADMQRAAYLELQIENARLRELLSLTGVNEQFVEHFVLQAASQAPQFPQEPNSALRQLKPKLTPLDTKRTFTSSGLASPIALRRGSASAIGQQHLTISGSRALSEPILISAPGSAYTSSPTFTNNTSLNLETALDWSLAMDSSSSQQPQLQPPSLEETHTCESFGFTTTGHFCVADENSVLCSMAKQMIDQYPISPTEMVNVRDKLAQGFCKPAFPGAGCAIDNQTLFRVLDDLNTKYL